MSKYKKVEWTPAKQERYREEVVKRTVVIICATLMDEFDYTFEDLVKFLNRFNRYDFYETSHQITIKKLKRIIDENLPSNNVVSDEALE